jgi:hypothetical protein
LLIVSIAIGCRSWYSKIRNGSNLVARAEPARNTGYVPRRAALPRRRSGPIWPQNSDRYRRLREIDTGEGYGQQWCLVPEWDCLDLVTGELPKAQGEESAAGPVEYVGPPMIGVATAGPGTGMEVTMFYKGPAFIGHPLDNPARRAAVFSSTATRASVPIVRSESADNMVAAIHEATHTAFNFYTGRGVLSVALDGDGGGEFRAHDGPVAPMLTGREPPTKIAADANSKLEWCSLLVGVISPLIAQRRYHAPASFDEICWHDLATVNRVLGAISESATEERNMRAEVERKARALLRCIGPLFCSLRERSMRAASSIGGRSRTCFRVPRRR